MGIAGLRYREATHDDALAIASLHAESWRATYRGAYRDEFLDSGVVQDRMQVWKTRLGAPPSDQMVVVAEDAGRLVGFACAYGSEDEQWGSLLDNIHVRPDRQGQGMGTCLLLEIATRCRADYAACGLYLWVLTQNQQAQRFYERRGATDRGGEVFVPPGGGRIDSRRYAWTTVTEIAHAGHG